MPEDFLNYWYYDNIFNKDTNYDWLELTPYTDPLSDRDLFAMFCMMSI